MKSLIFRLIAVVFFLSLASSAQSGDWSGFYVGIEVGGATADVEWKYPKDTGLAPFGVPASDHFSAVGHSIDQSDDAFTFGGHVGIQKQFSNVVIGGEVAWKIFDDLEDTTISPIGSSFHVFPNQGPEAQTAELENLLTVTAHIGYAIGNFLPYIKAGYARGTVEAISEDASLIGRDSEKLDGYVVGAGFNYRLLPNLLVGVDYNYVDLDSEEFRSDLSLKPGVGGVPAPPDFFRADIGVDELHTVTARLTFLLQRRVEEPLK